MINYQFIFLLNFFFLFSILILLQLFIYFLSSLFDQRCQFLRRWLIFQNFLICSDIIYIRIWYERSLMLLPILSQRSYSLLSVLEITFKLTTIVFTTDCISSYFIIYCLPLFLFC